MKPLRVFYAAGPGHVIGTFIHWKAGRDDPSEPAVAYSKQFFEVCRELNAAGYLVTACPHRGFLAEGQMRLEHRPYRLRSAGGLRFHLGRVWNGLGLVLSAVRFRADVAIVAEGSHWFMFSLMRLAGVKVVPSLHNALIARQASSSLPVRIIRRLNAAFFRKCCYAVLSASHDLSEQLAQLVGHPLPTVVEFLPLYNQQTFESVREPRRDETPFRVLFVGRVEPEKGVFDLVAVAQRLASMGRCNVEFDICGTGSALPQMQALAERMQVARQFHWHGYCNQYELADRYARCHAVIVPTKSCVGEGFNQVVVEAVLAERPVITSSVCPALRYVRGAVLEVAPDDVAAYTEAIVNLLGDPGLYENKRDSCRVLRSQFYDPDLSFGAALRRVLSAVVRRVPVEPFSLPMRVSGDVQSSVAAATPCGTAEDGG
jgi:glycogen(starch) synthase